MPPAIEINVAADIQSAAVAMPLAKGGDATTRGVVILRGRGSRPDRDTNVNTESNTYENEVPDGLVHHSSSVNPCFLSNLFIRYEYAISNPTKQKLNPVEPSRIQGGPRR